MVLAEGECRDTTVAKAKPARTAIQHPTLLSSYIRMRMRPDRHACRLTRLTTL